MSIFAELAQAAQLTELEEANEQLHGELIQKDNDIRCLRVDLDLERRIVSGLENDLKGSEGVIDAFASDLKDAERELDRLDDKIQFAVTNLRVLAEVPLRDLEASIEAIVKELTA